MQIYLPLYNSFHHVQMQFKRLTITRVLIKTQIKTVDIREQFVIKKSTKIENIQSCNK